MGMTMSEQAEAWVKENLPRFHRIVEGGEA